MIEVWACLRYLRCGYVLRVLLQIQTCTVQHSDTDTVTKILDFVMDKLQKLCSGFFFFLRVTLDGAFMPVLWCQYKSHTALVLTEAHQDVN